MPVRGDTTAWRYLSPAQRRGILSWLEVTDTKRNYARGRLLETLEHSPGRCQPECYSYSACGGCQLQHVDYAEQLRLKTVLVRDSLAGLEDVVVLPTVGMSDPWHYRNKAIFHVQEGDSGFDFGYYEEGSRTLTGFFKENSSCIGSTPRRLRPGSA